jgi:hypothetical protein
MGARAYVRERGGDSWLEGKQGLGGLEAVLVRWAWGLWGVLGGSVGGLAMHQVDYTALHH